MIVVSDTSPLRYLILINTVDVLPRLFGSIVVPPMVAEELRHPRAPEPVRGWMESAPAWLTVMAPSGDDLSLDVDAGERQAIVLAREMNAPLLIDDHKGKLAAVSRQIETLGTLAVLITAAER